MKSVRSYLRHFFRISTSMSFIMFVVGLIEGSPLAYYLLFTSGLLAGAGLIADRLNREESNVSS